MNSETSQTSIQIAMAVARSFFEGRGNHSEAHISETELAAVIAIAVDIALNGSVA